MTEASAEQAPIVESAMPSLEDVIASAPETPIEAPKDPITAEAVQSDKAPDESLPDSSLVANRLQAIRDRNTAQTEQVVEQRSVAELQEQVRLLRTLRGDDFDQQHAEASQTADSQDGDSSLLRELRSELMEMKKGHETLRVELEQRQQQQMLSEAQADVVTWVKDQKEHFPLLNEIGQQGLVFQKMMNEQNRTGQYISEAQAGREVELEVAAIVERCAPLLGYTKGQVEQRREEQVSVGAGAMSMADPLDLDKMSEVDAMEALIAQHEQNLR